MWFAWSRSGVPTLIIRNVGAGSQAHQLCFDTRRKDHVPEIMIHHTRTLWQLPAGIWLAGKGRQEIGGAMTKWSLKRENCSHERTTEPAADIAAD
jgi:hypothetical protein